MVCVIVREREKIEEEKIGGKRRKTDKGRRNGETEEKEEVNKKK